MERLFKAFGRRKSREKVELKELLTISTGARNAKKTYPKTFERNLVVVDR